MRKNRTRGNFMILFHCQEQSLAIYSIYNRGGHSRSVARKAPVLHLPWLGA